MDSRIAAAIDIGWERQCVKGGANVVIVTGWRAGAGYTNTMRIIKLPDSEKRPRAIPVLSAEKKSTA